MSRLYIFADEAGNFDFTRNRGATRYFILATVTAHSCHFGNELLDLHRDMAWRRMPVQHGCFHATTDSQAIRDEVFGMISKHDFTVQATIMEKSKAMPEIRATDQQFYKTGWLYHFRQSLKNRANKADELMVTADAIGIKRRKIDFEDSCREVVKRFTDRPKCVVGMWPAKSDPCLQFADYCTWAIQRKYEGGDDRSYKLISDRITYEYDLWEHGTQHYY